LQLRDGGDPEDLNEESQHFVSEWVAQTEAGVELERLWREAQIKEYFAELKSRGLNASCNDDARDFPIYLLFSSA